MMVLHGYKKLSQILFCVFLLVVIIAFLLGCARREPKSFRIYYDKIDTSILKDMRAYDINIVEASFFNKDDVSDVHSSTSHIVGYFSLIEIGYWDTVLINDLYECDFLRDESGEKLKSLNDENYLGDISSLHFRKTLLEQIDTRILDKGMDGVFLDTLDWIDYYGPKTGLYRKISTGYESFLKELRDNHPDIMIIQNRGFDSYKNFSHEYIDGLLWENFNSPYLEKDREEIQFLKDLKNRVKTNGTDMFVISFEHEKENRKIADRYNWSFLFSQMENRYSEWNIVVR